MTEIAGEKPLLFMAKVREQGLLVKDKKFPRYLLQSFRRAPDFYMFSREHDAG